MSTINCAMYNYQFNRHNVGVNKLVQIHFTMWCFPSCQNDRGRFCCFLRGLAAPFPCGSFIDIFAGFSVGGSDFCTMAFRIRIRSRSVFEKKENLGVCAKQKVRLTRLGKYYVVQYYTLYRCAENSISLFRLPI